MGRSSSWMNDTMICSYMIWYYSNGWIYDVWWWCKTRGTDSIPINSNNTSRIKNHGQVAERSIARDCKSLDESLRRFKSFPSQIVLRLWRFALLIKPEFSNIYGPLAHLARAPRLHRGGEGFDSPRVHQKRFIFG